ncbi:uncharacterized protein RCC_08806 [Ramularia collo-cygni]|uniref:Uncharacterized protein n=1 Tax=Ramularia collo-cygni TaxID=112498 RepID=A0A2D3V128_9PEZI|nr:uncharacterized protein RCC_08806 [Ramularia collo-cygni]CZT23096.1 uncharacterized protein RCC_08806 [Ramularia collo-cygni]
MVSATRKRRADDALMSQAKREMPSASSSHSASSSLAIEPVAAADAERLRRKLANHGTRLIRLPPEMRNRLYSLLLPESKDVILRYPVKSGGGNLPNTPILQVCQALREEVASAYFKGTSLVVMPNPGMNPFPWIPKSLETIPSMPARYCTTIHVTTRVSIPQHLHYNCRARTMVDKVSWSTPATNVVLDTTATNIVLTFSLNSNNAYRVFTDFINPRDFVAGNGSLPQVRQDKFDDMWEFASVQIEAFEEKMKVVLMGRDIQRDAEGAFIMVFDYPEDRDEWRTKAGVML